MQNSTKNNRYKFEEGDSAFIVFDENRTIVKIKVIKRLKRPYRLSDNFYFCEWTNGNIKTNGIRYEAEMFKTIEDAESFVYKLTTAVDDVI